QPHPHLPSFPTRRSSDLARAQAPATATATGDVVQLGQFTVSTSIGKYTETNTTAATKMPVDFKDLASSLQELNSSLLGDLRALTDRKSTRLNSSHRTTSY